MLLCVGPIFQSLGLLGGIDGKSYIQPDFQFALKVDIILNVVIAVALLLGTYKEKADLLQPCVLLTIVEIICFAVAILLLIISNKSLITSLASEPITGDSSNFENFVHFATIIVSIEAFLIIFAIFKAYSCVVINSHHVELKDILERRTHQRIILRDVLPR